ncbi:MAG TPA: hypothetical protein VLH19_03675 [Patescibacteria group bacterium]|nr:hypothetical protein [Patescibacteria group bacterium]
MSAIKTAVTKVRDLDRQRLQTFEKKKAAIEIAANKIAAGKNSEIVIVDFGPVVGFVFDPRQQKLVDKVDALKHRATSHDQPLALITRPEYLSKLVNHKDIPVWLDKLIQDMSLPQAVHYRLSADGKELPETVWSKGKNGTKMIQVALFGEDASPELSYLLTLLWKKGIHFVAATSANVHGVSETEIYRRGKTIADVQGFFYLDAAPLGHEIAGSFPGIEIDSEVEGFVLFREGHLHELHIRQVFAGYSLRRDDKAKASTYPYSADLLERELTTAIALLPHRIRLQVLFALAASE